MIPPTPRIPSLLTISICGIQVTTFMNSEEMALGHLNIIGMQVVAGPAKHPFRPIYLGGRDFSLQTNKWECSLLTQAERGASSRSDVKQKTGSEKEGNQIRGHYVGR